MIASAGQLKPPGCVRSSRHRCLNGAAKAFPRPGCSTCNCSDRTCSGTNRKAIDGGYSYEPGHLSRRLLPAGVVTGIVIPHQWSDRAYVFLLDYIKSRDFYNREFMTEDVRVASESELPAPPDKRAWGGIVRRAAKAGLIERIGYSHVKNFKAHRTPAAVWRVVIA